MTTQSATQAPPPDEHPFRTRRINLRLSCIELARRCGLNSGALSAIETGFARYPSAPTLALLAREFGTTMDELYAELEAWNLKRPRAAGASRRSLRRAS